MSRYFALTIIQINVLIYIVSRKFKMFTLSCHQNTNLQYHKKELIKQTVVGFLKINPKISLEQINAAIVHSQLLNRTVVNTVIVM